MICLPFSVKCGGYEVEAVLEVGIKIEEKKWPFLMRKLRLSNTQVNS